MLIAYLSLALVVSFVCSILESVLLSTTMSHAHLLARDGKKSGTRWLALKKHDAIEPLTAILTLNTIAHTVGALGVGVEVEATFPGEYTVAIASAVLTLAILLFSEILPKTLGASYWRQLGPGASATLVWFVKVLRPFVALTLVLKKLLPSPDTKVVTRDELAILADIGESEGTIAEDEETVITNVLNLRNIEVREIMTPRVVIDAWPVNFTVQQALDETPRTSFSRILLYGDSKDDLRGFVLRTDILLAAINGEGGRLLLEFLREPKIVTADQNTAEVFKSLLRSQAHIAIVHDEFGGTAGILTLEDVIETLLGAEIVDEGDEVADMRELARQQALSDADVNSESET